MALASAIAAQAQTNPDFSGTWRLDPLQTTVSGGPTRVSSGGPTSGVTAPVKTRNVPPVYPPEAMRAGVQGLVIVEAVIDRDGNVVDVQVVRPVPLLDQAALDAVRQWKFTPATLSGVPVACLMTVTVNFGLGGPHSGPPMTPRFGAPSGRPGGGGANVQARGLIESRPVNTITIMQDASTMIVDHGNEKLTYRLDGTASRNLARVAMSGEFVYVSRWDAATLHTEITTPANAEARRTERRWLDNGRMIVETTLAIPGAEPLVSRQVFVKVP